MKNINAQFQGQFNQFHLDVDFTIAPNGVTAIYGPSGCGKTTLLRCLAGLEPRVKGTLQVGGETWQSNAEFLPPHKRAVGYVFQEAGLFSHLTVKGNLEFGKKRRNTTPNEKQTNEIIDLLGVRPLMDRRTQNLSGGEKQRVSIARALLAIPEMLLMDEPLSALDRTSKSEIIPFLDSLQKNLNIPILYVSHDLSEVEQFADHIIMMEQGRITKSGALLDVLSAVNSPLAEGEDASVLLEGKVTAYDPNYDLSTVAAGSCHLHLPGEIGTAGSIKRLRISASDVGLAVNPTGAGFSYLNMIDGKIIEAQPQGKGKVNVILSIGEMRLISSITRRSYEALKLDTGQNVTAMIKSIALVDPS